jgi:hypothetical protein
LEETVDNSWGVEQTALTEANAEVYATQGVLFISEIKTLKLDIMTEKV